MSNFVVSARKYRPATFDEVVGQAHVAKTLKNALQTDKLAHAFLFCGPRGVGKTTCARILAKVINCENPVDKVEPCNTCSSCKSFNDNASFNIIELDAASNNSVEHIRTLIEQVRFQPQQGTHKVFIIDEVHMLSSQAFNAFLKTLEEPPPYAIFILATTDKHKIIPTILSRCQIFDFKRIQVQDAVEQLQYICQQEGKTAEQEALHLIGQKADGAMRDALSIFDKIASATGEQITYKDVIANLNILDYEYYFKVVDAFLREDLSEVLLIMDEVIRAGFEPDQFIQGLSDHMRDLLVCKDARTLTLLDVSDGLKSRYQHQAALSSKSVLLSGLDILNQCDITLPRSKNKRLYTEIALSKINFANNSAPQAAQPKIERTQEAPDQSPTQAPAPVSATPTQATQPTTNAPISNVTSPSPSTSNNAPASIPVFKKPSGLDAILASVKQEEEQIKELRKGRTQETLEKLWRDYSDKHPSPSMRTTLELAMIKLDDKTVKITVPSNHYANMILEEDELKDLLRTQMGTPDLTIEPTVAERA